MKKNTTDSEKRKLLKLCKLLLEIIYSGRIKKSKVENAYKKAGFDKVDINRLFFSKKEQRKKKFKCSQDSLFDLEK